MIVGTSTNLLHPSDLPFYEWQVCYGAADSLFYRTIKRRLFGPNTGVRSERRTLSMDQPAALMSRWTIPLLHCGGGDRIINGIRFMNNPFDQTAQPREI